MNLIRINEVVETFGVSSRTLRYYEEKGLIWSSHPNNKAQRYYDSNALERLKQIIVLRKLQIPIKDMIAIFQSESTAALTQAFVSKLESLDVEIAALAELRNLVDDFLGKMISSGIKKISAITLLYEETEKRISVPEKAVTFEQLDQVSRGALRLHDVRIIRLPGMRVLTSQLKVGSVVELDMDKMQNLFAEYGFLPQPGLRNCFYFIQQDGNWIMAIKIPNDYVNETLYVDEDFPGGLYAVASAFFEDVDDTFVVLKDWICDSQDYELDQRLEMIEEILPWDIALKFNRFQQDVFIPIKLKEEI